MRLCSFKYVPPFSLSVFGDVLMRFFCSPSREILEDDGRLGLGSFGFFFSESCRSISSFFSVLAIHSLCRTFTSQPKREKERGE